MTPPHEEYQRQLKSLRLDAFATQALSEAGRARGWWGPATPWSRTFGRFNPKEAAFASLVFESLGQGPMHALVDVFQDRPAVDPASFTHLVEEVGFVRVAPFTTDARLKNLAPLLREHPDATVVRYRPAKRCTLRLGSNGHPRRYAKVFPDDSGRPLHEAGEALWAAMEHGTLRFRVAKPLRWDADACTLWQREVSGAPVLASLCGPKAETLAHKMGAAVASLKYSGLDPAATFDSVSQMERSLNYATGLSDRVPLLAPAVRELIAQLKALHERSGAGVLQVIHGAPHANQWLHDGESLALVDFDRISWGEAELDVATFLGELDFEEGLQIPVERIDAAFVEGYESVAGSLNDGRMRAYRAHKRLAKALRSSRALRPDGDARAARHLSKAFECLEGA